MALGASRNGVQWMVLRESLAMLGLGFALGVPAALAATRLTASMLYGLTPAGPRQHSGITGRDGGSFDGAALVQRAAAARVDPMVALRYE